MKVCCKEKRNYFFDILKGIAIILVIIGHNIQFGSGQEFYQGAYYFDNFLFKFIYTFHMPLFMIVSGYLFYFSVKKYTVFKCFLSKLRRLLIPIILWSLVPIFLVIINSGYDNILVSIIRTLLSNLWFLWAILYCSIIVIINHYYFKDSLLLYIFIGGILFLIPDALNFHLYKYMYPYFIFGYISGKEDLFSKMTCLLNKQKIKYLLFIILVYIILYLNFNNDMYIYNSTMNVLNGNFFEIIGIAIFRWIIGFLGSFIIIFIVSILYEKLREKGNICGQFLIFCGKNSLLFYLINDLINKYILLNVTYNLEFSYVIIIVETLIMLLICSVVEFLLQKLPDLQKILLGL